MACSSVSRVLWKNPGPGTQQTCTWDVPGCALALTAAAGGCRGSGGMCGVRAVVSTWEGSQDCSSVCWCPNRKGRGRMNTWGVKLCSWGTSGSEGQGPTRALSSSSSSLWQVTDNRGTKDSAIWNGRKHFGVMKSRAGESCLSHWWKKIIKKPAGENPGEVYLSFNMQMCKITAPV